MGKTSEKAKTMVILHKLKIRKKTSMLSSHVITGGCKLSLFLYGCLCTTKRKRKKKKKKSKGAPNYFHLSLALQNEMLYWVTALEIRSP